MAKQKTQFSSPPLQNSSNVPVPEDIVVAAAQNTSLAEPTSPNLKSPQRASFFSSLRSAVVPIPALLGVSPSLVSETAVPPSQLPTPPLVSPEGQATVPPSGGFGGFFRRSSSNSINLSLPALLGGKTGPAEILPEESPAATSVEPSISSDLSESHHSPKGTKTADCQKDIVEDSTRIGRSMDSNRSSMDIMTDVKL